MKDEGILKMWIFGKHIQLSLAHEGTFGFTAVLSIGLGKGNARDNANLYYYNPATKELEPVSTAVVTEDGKAEFVFYHASDYLIIVDQEPGETEESDGTEENEEPRETEESGGTEENEEPGETKESA